MGFFSGSVRRRGLALVVVAALAIGSSVAQASPVTASASGDGRMDAKLRAEGLHFVHAWETFQDCKYVSPCENALTGMGRAGAAFSDRLRVRLKVVTMKNFCRLYMNRFETASRGWVVAATAFQKAHSYAAHLKVDSASAKVGKAMTRAATACS